MTVPSPESAFAVSFRDGDAPRPLADRPLAFAHRHVRGWTLAYLDTGSTEHLTFDAVAAAVLRRYGVRNLLIRWPGRAL
jgi:hypothetical protein